MKRNIGTTERLGRATVGLVLLSLIYFIDSDWRWIGLIGILLLGTAMFGWCAIYALFGITTCQNKADNWVIVKRSTRHSVGYGGPSVLEHDNKPGQRLKYSPLKRFG